MKIIECPRDAMQGIDKFIPTSEKVRYLNQLMKVGYDTIDAGSFVSPKAIPQLRDTAEVLDQVVFGQSKTKILAIVANTRGALDACRHDAVTYLGFPLSLSEKFQQRNTNKSIPQALNSLNEIQEACLASNRKLVVYISMGFGNPYGDPYDMNIVGNFVDILSTMDIKIVSLADTIGVSKPDQIRHLFTQLTKGFPGLEFGAHLHSSPDKALEKIEAAIDSGCQRFDGAIKGYGGCPMAKDELVGNLATEAILSCLESRKLGHNLDMEAFNSAMILADEIFKK